MSNFMRMRAFPSIKRFLVLLVCLAAVQGIRAQQHSALDTIRVAAFITPEGDTIPMGFLPPLTVEAKLSPQMKKYWAEWTRLRNAIYVTFPYAKTAGRIMNEINAKLVNVSDKKQRKAIIRAREKELKKEFTDKLTQLSVYQGKILMKLIYRETGNNCYEIIEEYKGYFTAAFYQGVAFVFGTSLKQNYDPAGSERTMEAIVRDVERMYGYRS